jgi:hypothetical protein
LVVPPRFANPKSAGSRYNRSSASTHERKLCTSMEGTFLPLR